MRYICLRENLDVSCYLHVWKEIEFLESAYRKLAKKFIVLPLCIDMLCLNVENVYELGCGEDC
jgi:hypothetical protein